MGRGAVPFCGGEGEIKMNLFTSYEEENIHYWTHRASGYSGVNQEELATAVGTTRQTITSIEVGKYTASLPLAYKIARYFGLSIEDVFDFSEIDEEN